MLDEGLEKIKIKLIKTCNILKNIIYKESEEWEYIFRAMQKINNGRKNKINRLKKKFNIEYGDLYNTSSGCIKISFEPDPKGIELRKYYEKCKEDYDRTQKIDEPMNDILCIFDHLCTFNKYNKNLVDYNKKDIQGLIKNYMSSSLLDISNLIKSKIIKNLSFDISELIPDKKKFLNQYLELEQNTQNINESSLKKQKSVNKIYSEPKLYISPNRINKNMFDTDDFILQMLCFLMESHYEDDDIDKKLEELLNS